MFLFIVMKPLSWNVRDLGRLVKRRRIKKILFDNKVDMVFLQETKKSDINTEAVRSIWAGEMMDFMTVDSDGAVGGLLCVWNPEVFQIKDCCCTKNYILLSGTLYQSFGCVLVNVYGPNDVVKRRNVWDILLNIKSGFRNPWCLGGRF